MITLQQLNRAAETQTENKARTCRRAYYIATNEGNHSRCSKSNYEKALNCVRIYNRLNNARDKFLYWDQFDNDTARKLSKMYDNECDKIEKRLNKKLKRFGFFVTWGTFAHVSPIGHAEREIF